jgi:hypothetical protein
LDKVKKRCMSSADAGDATSGASTEGTFWTPNKKIVAVCVGIALLVIVIGLSVGLTSGGKGSPTGTPAVTERGTPGPTAGPTGGPTHGPTAGPTHGPTAGPTQGPTAGPTAGPTHGPTHGPTAGPTAGPTEGPTQGPTQGPTAGPTEGPTGGPTQGPTAGPTAGPTHGPTAGPTAGPTQGPTQGPTAGPTQGPTAGLTQGPTATTATTALPTTPVPAAAAIVPSATTNQPVSVPAAMAAAFQFPQCPSDDEWRNAEERRKVFWVCDAPDEDGMNGVYAFWQNSMWKKVANASGGKEKECFLYEWPNVSGGGLHLYRKKDDSNYFDEIGSFGVVDTPCPNAIRKLVPQKAACNLKCYLRPVSGIWGGASELRVYVDNGTNYLRFVKPTIGAHFDVWDGMLNGNPIWLTTSGFTHVGGPIPPSAGMIYQMTERGVHYGVIFEGGTNTWKNTVSHQVHRLRFEAV